MKVEFFEIGQIEEKALKFAVISARLGQKWIFVKHKDRDTWEIPGGHRETGEDIAAAAKRELFEETGASCFEIKPICDYSVKRADEASFGRLFYAEVQTLGVLPDLEIESVELFDKLPEKLTYPDIQPLLHKRVLKEKLNMRRAEAKEADILTDIAVSSEAYWGYDTDFMNSFKSIYKVTENIINNNPTYVIEENDNIIAFYSLITEENIASLEYFYIAPEFIGKGYGRLLWEHLIDSCKALGINKVTLVTSPQAQEFYIKMGAVKDCEIESLVRKGRRIPQLVYTLENKKFIK